MALKQKLTSRDLSAAIISIVFVGVLVIVTHRFRMSLASPTFATGWTLFGLMLFLAFYNSRKRLSMLPMARASTWLLLHLVGGLSAVCIFWLHTGNLWPKGGYQQVLAFLFYSVSISGIIGYALQKTYPGLLTHTGVEIIYERIPGELANLREQAEAIALNCAKETGSSTLARHYVAEIDWFLRRPRFFLNNALGRGKGQAWHRQQRDNVLRYLSSREKNFLDEISEIIDYKLDLDFHYAAQSVMRGWLLVHVPMAAALLLLSIWHIIVVHVYAA